MTTLLAGVFLLGVLVFVHELGHFLVAKATGVRVLTFSLGFGPRLFGFTRGDTDYRISAIPLGGYVRMYGDDPGEEVPAEERSRSFLHKPIPQKSAIAFAGPLANFLLPVGLFFALWVGTEEVPSSQIGTVIPGEAAARAGLLAADRVVRIEEEAIETFGELQRWVERNPGRPLRVEVERAGQRVSLVVTPRADTSADPTGASEVGRIGVMPGSRRPYLRVLPGSPAALAGLESGDLIETFNDAPVASWEDLDTLLTTHVAAEWRLRVRRGELPAPARDPVGNRKDLAPPIDPAPPRVELVTVPATSPPAAETLPGDPAPPPETRRSGVTREELAAEPLQSALTRTRDVLATARLRATVTRGLEALDGTLQAVLEDTVAARMGLRGGDRVVALDGEPLYLGASLNLQLLADPDGVHLLGVIDAAGAPWLYAFRMEGGKKHGQEDFKTLGAFPLGGLYSSGELRSHEVGPGEALSRATQRTLELIVATARSLLQLFTGKVGFSSLGGPVTIVNFAGQAAEQGLDRYLELMAFISVNLGLVNLLPIPVLDGGHLLMFAIEGVTRRRLDLKTRERAMKVGLTLLLILIVGALVNDFLRLL